MLQVAVPSRALPWAPGKLTSYKRPVLMMYTGMDSRVSAKKVKNKKLNLWVIKHQVGTCEAMHSPPGDASTG
jgi:hypothetical protein